jgi:hypothetical protein
VLDRDDEASIQAQLQQLYAQIRILQDTLKAKSATTKPSPASSPSQDAWPTVSEAPRASLARPASVELLYKYAWAAYRASVWDLGRVATALDSEDMPPRVIAPLAISLMQRLTAIDENAWLANDFTTRKMVHSSKNVVRSLAAKLNVPAPTYTLHTLHEVGNLSPSTLSASKLNWFATHIYRFSVRALIDAAKVVEEMRSPAVAPIAFRLRDQLRMILSRTSNAKIGKPVFAKDGNATWRVLADYGNWRSVYAEARYSSTTIKNPVLLFALLLADSQQVVQRETAAVQSLQADVLQRRMHGSNRQSSPQTTLSTKSRNALDSMELEFERPEYPTKIRGPVAFEDKAMDDLAEHDKPATYMAEMNHGEQRLTQQIQTQSRSMMSSDHLNTNSQAVRTDTTRSDKHLKSDHEVSSTPMKDTKTRTTAPPHSVAKSARGKNEHNGQSLLEELFPEANTFPQPRHSEKRDEYPKVDPPISTPVIRRELVDQPLTLKQQVVESFQKKGEETTVLQLSHCSTELTEADFRRLIPKGKHIDAWHRGGDFYKIIPGRDPLSLERMPFYYILFKDSDSALAYQRNASRLHKLSALHQPANILSAVPAPKGFLEDGEDINAAVSSYNLLPIHHQLSLNVVMQPYNPALRALIERGGYQPIALSVDENGERIWKVLMYIEGYEPSPSDLFKIFSRDAYVHGMSIPLRNESHSSIHRLRDIVNLKTSTKPISSVNPRAYGASNPPPASVLYEDAAIQSMLAGADEHTGAKEINQWVMNRVYNRWVLDFEDEDSARRFAVGWHRKVLPELSAGKGAWKDGEEVRVCNTELLW